VTEKQSAQARVRLTVEVDVRSSWGDDCSVKQVYDQAATEAANHLEHVLSQHSERRIKIIGQVEVDAIIATKRLGRAYRF
jgi:hypothetical protein